MDKLAINFHNNKRSFKQVEVYILGLQIDPSMTFDNIYQSPIFQPYIDKSIYFDPLDPSKMAATLKIKNCFIYFTFTTDNDHSIKDITILTHKWMQL